MVPSNKCCTARRANHGCVCSCVGPIIDAQMRSNLFYKEKFMIIQIRPVLSIRDVFLASVYDALLVIRRRCNFRHGRVIKNYTANFRQYFIQLAFNDGYLFGLIHLIPANYRSTLGLWSRSRSIEFGQQQKSYTIINGFGAVFLFIKSYASCLVGELSQLCYKGVLRTIALGSTQCLCAWRALSLIGLQPLIVPAGRIALGRIFNLVGSIIDPYMELCNSCQFNKVTFAVKGFLVESNFLWETYATSCPNHHLFLGLSCVLTASFYRFWNTLIIL